MAHLLFIRMATSSIDSPHIRVGTSEVLDKNINTRKYRLDGYRKGYNIPFITKWEFYDERLKEEIIPHHLADIRPLIFNPQDNKMTLLQVFGKADGSKVQRGWDKAHKKDTVGKLFKFIVWLFKWINRPKRTTAFFLGFASIPFLVMLNLTGFFLSMIMLLIFSPIILFVLINPIKPVPTPLDVKRDKFAPSWNYHICWGMLKDPVERDPITKEVIYRDTL